MLAHTDVLSLWEISHRWHGYDPNVTDPRALPIEVQDTLRLLTKLMYNHELNSARPSGVENWTRAGMLGYRDFVRSNEYGKRITEKKRRALYEEYVDLFENNVKPHDQVVEGFELCFRDRIYNKAKLDSVYIVQLTLFEVCQEKGFEPPKFWPMEGADQAGHKAKPGHIAKELVQAVARTLWYTHPDMTIADMLKHKAIQIYASGAQYTEKYLRSWIKEVDPRPPEEKRGRPKKKKLSESE